MTDYLQYLSDSEHNLKVSLLDIPEAVGLFDRVDRHLGDMVRHLSALPGLTAADCFFFIGTFLAVTQRQLRNAFTLLLCRMSYDALLVFRVGVESAVFAYRIFRAPELLEVWARKNENWREFSERFRREESPDDVPYRVELKNEVDQLNEYWAHPNINYFSTALVIEGGEMRVHSFDHEDRLFHLLALSFLDLCIKIVAVYRRVFEDRLRVFVTSTEGEYQALAHAHEEIREGWRERVGRGRGE